MLKIAQITDLHLFPEINEQLLNVNTWDTFIKVMDHLNQNNYQAIIVTGDIADQGDVEAYANFLIGLKNVTCPVHYVLGNHDQQSAYQKIVSLFSVINNTKLAIYNSWCLLFLNTQVYLSDYGTLSEAELQFLQQSIAEHSDKHIAIFMHHHPVSINSPLMDECMLSNPQDLLQIIQGAANVKLVCFGHIHQEFTTELNGIHFIGCPATSVQFKPFAKTLELDATNGPGYREFIFNDNGSFKTQVHRVLGDVL